MKITLKNQNFLTCGHGWFYCKNMVIIQGNKYGVKKYSGLAKALSFINHSLRHNAIGIQRMSSQIKSNSQIIQNFIISHINKSTSTWIQYELSAAIHDSH